MMVMEKNFDCSVIRVGISFDVNRNFPLNVSNVLSWSRFAVADQYYTKYASLASADMRSTNCVRSSKKAALVFGGRYRQDRKKEAHQCCLSSRHKCPNSSDSKSPIRFPLYHHERK